MTLTDPEIERIGSVTVAWPRVICAACGGQAPQRHGQPLLTLARADGEPAPSCTRCSGLALLLGGGSDLGAVLRHRDRAR